MSSSQQEKGVGDWDKRETKSHNLNPGDVVAAVGKQPNLSLPPSRLPLLLAGDTRGLGQSQKARLRLVF